MNVERSSGDRLACCTAFWTKCKQLYYAAGGTQIIKMGCCTAFYKKKSYILKLLKCTISGKSHLIVRVCLINSSSICKSRHFPSVLMLLSQAGLCLASTSKSLCHLTGAAGCSTGMLGGGEQRSQSFWGFTN